MADLNPTNDVSRYYKDPATGTTYLSPDVARQYGVKVPDAPAVTRYTTPPAVPTPPSLPPPGPEPLATPTVPALGSVDEQSIREQTRKNMQASIDAINAQYADLITQEQNTGLDRAGQTRASNARSGTLGSDFGETQAVKTDQFNASQVKALENEKTAKIAAVQANIEDRASQVIRDAKNDALNKYNIDNAAYLKTQEAAMGDLKTLAAKGAYLDQALTPAQKTALFKQAGYTDTAMGEVIYNAMKPSATKIDYKFEKLADGQGLFYGVDPTTGELKMQKVSVNIPPGYDLTIAPDGTPLVFNKTTGEAQVAAGFGKGSLAKPTNSISELLDNPKKQAAFNTIVNKYNTSPLIQAADRTLVLKNTIESAKKDPSNGAQQIALAYGFIQALDTYQSAVREGELSLVNSIDSKVGKFQNTIQQIQNGQAVRPEVALEIASAASDLVTYIADGAQQKEKVFASQARVNGIEDAWNSFRSGFSTSYDQTDNSDPLSDPSLKPDIDALRKGIPGITDEEIIQSLKETGRLKGERGSGPGKDVTVAFPEDSKGGQCGDFAHRLVDFPSVGNSKSEKLAAVVKYGIPAAEWRDDVRVGDVIITGENPTYGHVAVVNAVLPNGQVRLSESNYKQSETVSHTRTIPINSSRSTETALPRS